MLFLSLFKKRDENFEEYKQKSIDFANNIDRWYDEIQKKKKIKIENDEEFVYLESSPSRFT